MSQSVAALPALVFCCALVTVGAQSDSVQVSRSGRGAYEASLAAHPLGFAVAWHDTRHGVPEIYARLVDRIGRPVSDEYRLTADAGRSYEPSIDVPDPEISDDLIVAWVRGGGGRLLVTRDSRRVVSRRYAALDEDAVRSSARRAGGGGCRGWRSDAVRLDRGNSPCAGGRPSREGRTGQPGGGCRTECLGRRLGATARSRRRAPGRSVPGRRREPHDVEPESERGCRGRPLGCLRCAVGDERPRDLPGSPRPGPGGSGTVERRRRRILHLSRPRFRRRTSRRHMVGRSRWQRGGLSRGRRRGRAAERNRESGVACDRYGGCVDWRLRRLERDALRAGVVR